uniref:Anoctamin n=1 Tax=Panagrellus redivivus TaxID=6233 RepID=A0A7E4W5E1_PANRE
MVQLGSAYTFGNICLMIAFISLPMGIYLIMALSELPGDVVDGNMLLLQAQTTWDSTVYCVAFFVISLIAANIIRMLVAVHTDYEIALWITREVYKQNVDDERTARRYDRDRQALAAYKEAQEVTRHTTGVQELVEEVFTQATTDDNAGKTHDDVPDADRFQPKDSSKKSKKSMKSTKSKKSKKDTNINKSIKSLKSNKSKKGVKDAAANVSKKVLKLPLASKKSAKSPSASAKQTPLTNRGMSMIGSLNVEKTQRSSGRATKTTQPSNFVESKTQGEGKTPVEAKTQSLSLSLNDTQNDD